MSTSEVINICLSAATILLSLVAIVISVQTAKKQNRIELFEKRMEVYSVTQKLVLLGEQMRTKELAHDCKTYNINYFLQTLRYIFSDGKEYSITLDEFNRISIYVSSVISSAAFLFDEKIANEIEKLHTQLLQIEHDHKNENVMEKVSAFSSSAIDVANSAIPAMEKFLKL